MVCAMSKVVALSGGIGSGKTTVRGILDDLGAVTICADAIVHALQAPGSPILETIAEAFGPGVIDAAGHLDRAALWEARDAARAPLDGLSHVRPLRRHIRPGGRAEQP